MTTRKFKHRGILAVCLAAGIGDPLQFSRPRRPRPAPIKVAVFDFELKDTSAGGGIIAADAIDTENLKKSTEQVARCFRIRAVSALSTPALSRAK